MQPPMRVVPSMLVARFGRQGREPFQLATPSEVCNQPAAPLVVRFQLVPFLQAVVAQIAVVSKLMD